MLKYRRGELHFGGHKGPGPDFRMGGGRPRPLLEPPLLAWSHRKFVAHLSEVCGYFLQTSEIKTFEGLKQATILEQYLSALDIVPLSGRT